VKLDEKPRSLAELLNKSVMFISDKKILAKKGQGILKGTLKLFSLR
jgi:hypothetical protein